MKYQRGTNTVEFSIAGAAFFLLLFGALEVGRLFYTLHGLTEATRRGARVAAVCPMGHGSISNVAAFGDPASGGGGLIPALTPDKFVVSYLTESGAATNNFADVRYVRVAVTGFDHNLIIPGFANTITLPSLETTLPRESLGVPREGVVECPY